MPKLEHKILLGKLFKEIQTDTYNRVLKRLKRERMLNPRNRDDELLMYMLCKRIEGDREYTDL